MTGQANTKAGFGSAHACNCIGPQGGEPLCPCMMRARGVNKRNGRWVEPEKDLGPADGGRDFLQEWLEQRPWEGEV